MSVKFFNSIPDIFVIIFVIKTVSSMDAENPLVDVEAFPRTAPQLSLQQYKNVNTKKLANQY